MGVTVAETVETDLPALVAALEGRLSQIGRAELAEALQPLIEAMREATGAEAAAQAARTAFDFCRRLYANGRSAEGLPLAGAILDGAVARRDRDLERKAAMVCGLLAGDKADIVAAVE